MLKLRSYFFMSLFFSLIYFIFLSTLNFHLTNYGLHPNEIAEAILNSLGFVLGSSINDSVYPYYRSISSYFELFFLLISLSPPVIFFLIFSRKVRKNKFSYIFGIFVISFVIMIAVNIISTSPVFRSEPESFYQPIPSVLS